MPLNFSDGVFRVSCCERGHVTLEVLDGDAVKFVSVMSEPEALALALQLLVAIDAELPRGGIRLSDRRGSPEVH